MLRTNLFNHRGACGLASPWRPARAATSSSFCQPHHARADLCVCTRGRPRHLIHTNNRQGSHSPQRISHAFSVVHRFNQWESVFTNRDYNHHCRSEHRDPQRIETARRGLHVTSPPLLVSTDDRQVDPGSTGQASTVQV